MSHKPLFVIMTVLVVLGGCTPIHITQPLSNPMTEEPDQLLYGHWVAKQDTEESHIFIGESRKLAGSISKPFMEFAMVHWKGGSSKVTSPPFAGYLTVTRIGKYSYVNIFRQSKEGRDN